MHGVAKGMGLRNWRTRCSSRASQKDFCPEQLQYIQDFVVQQQAPPQLAITDIVTAPTGETSDDTADIVTVPQGSSTSGALMRLLQQQQQQQQQMTHTHGDPIAYDPGMVPEPVLLSTGETLYPGETTAVPTQAAYFPM